MSERETSYLTCERSVCDAT